jgi:hypothetical protein
MAGSYPLPSETTRGFALAYITLNGVSVILVSSIASGQPEYIFAGSMGSMGTSSTSGGVNAQVRSDVRTTGGSVRQYANGTFRVVATVGMMITYGTTLRALTWDDVQTLASWANQLVLIRDRLGRQWYGAFSGISVMDYPGGSQLHDVSFSFVQVSYSDAV